MLWAWFGVLGCTGPSSDDTPQEVAASVAIVPAELLAQTWQVRMADATVRAPYEQHPGWSLLFQRDLEGALRAFEQEPKHEGGMFRANLELAALYRQAASLAYGATLQVYGVDHQATDPVDVGYLLLSADQCLEAPEFGRDFMRAPVNPVFARRAELDFEASCPTISAGRLAGEWASHPDDPPSSMRVFDAPEQTPEQKPVQVFDPGELMALSSWHLSKVPESPQNVDAAVAWLAPWYLPLELWSTRPATTTVPDDLLFAGFYGTSSDVVFVAEACRAKAPPAAFPDSPLALVVGGAIEGDRLDVQRLLERAQAFHDELLQAMATKAGATEGFHRTFAQLGQLGALRAGVCVADALGQADDAQLLRVNIHDLADGPTKDPVFTLSLAAWDAAHRNAVRSLDLVHGLSQSFPQLELARVPLDAMSVRLSRNSAPSAPVH